MNAQTIAFAAGSSGGHIIPCLTLANKKRQQEPNTHVVFFSTNTPLDKKLLANNEIVDTHVIYNLKLQKNWLYYPRLAWNVLHAVWDSFWHLRKTQPAKIVSTGGLIALPVCIAGWMQNIPIELWELNAVPGSAIAWCAPFARSIVVNVPRAQQYFDGKYCTLKPYPVKYAINKTYEKYDACKQLNLAPNKKTILILGGSQGSVFLNTAIEKLIAHNKNNLANIQIIHQTGNNDSRDWQAFYASHTIHAVTFPFTNDLALHYAAADMVICRAGAGTLHETVFFEKPFITIPLEISSTSHQVDNAYALRDAHPELCHVILEDDIRSDVNTLHTLVKDILNI